MWLSLQSPWCTSRSFRPPRRLRVFCGRTGKTRRTRTLHVDGRGGQKSEFVGSSSIFLNSQILLLPFLARSPLAESFGLVKSIFVFPIRRVIGLPGSFPHVYALRDDESSLLRSILAGIDGQRRERFSAKHKHPPRGGLCADARLLVAGLGGLVPTSAADHVSEACL